MLRELVLALRSTSGNSWTRATCPGQRQVSASLNLRFSALAYLVTIRGTSYDYVCQPDYLPTETIAGVSARNVVSRTAIYRSLGYLQLVFASRDRLTWNGEERCIFPVAILDKVPLSGGNFEAGGGGGLGRGTWLGATRNGLLPHSPAATLASPSVQTVVGAVATLVSSPGDPVHSTALGRAGRPWSKG